MRTQSICFQALIVCGAMLAGCGKNAVAPAKPVFLRGQVVSALGGAISGAVVSALDVNDTPITPSVRTDAAGAYELDVTVARNQFIKLRAAATGYAAFPSGIRRSLPVSLAAAVETPNAWIVSGVAGEISLLPLANLAGLGGISGSVGGSGSALVVAEGPGVGSTVSGPDGAYVIFNLPTGAYTVHGYAAGRQFTPANAAVVAGQETTGVNLAVSPAALGSVSGNVSIVNAPGGSMTSIVLVVASTFDSALARGDVPPGLRAPRTGAPNVTGAFTITDVPDGTYKVLAAFENDGLVRDPDLNIAGTQIVQVTVNGNAASIPTTFKITGALAVTSPGAGDQPEVISGTPTFVWADDSSEDHYSVDLLDSFGNTIWFDNSVPSVSGSPTVSLPYTGPALESGHTYQFRATSWRATSPISQTEDLRGVFIVQ